MAPTDDMATHFRCTKCPNLILKPEEREPHRAFHRNLREERETRASAARAAREREREAEMAKKRPGPASRTMPGRRAKVPRVESSVLSSDFESLFVRHEAAIEEESRRPMLNRSQIEKMRQIVDEPIDDEEDPDSPGNRRRRALRKSLNNTPIYRMKFNGA